MNLLKIIAVALLGLFVTNPVSAQKIAFVDVQYILDNMPEYETAQAELNRLSGKWQKEIEDRYEQIKKLKDAFQAESILLTPEMKKQRQADIKKKEKSKNDKGAKGKNKSKKEEVPIKEEVPENTTTPEKTESSDNGDV